MRNSQATSYYNQLLVVIVSRFNIAFYWQICLTATDYLEEGQNSFHPIERSASHESQKEESKPYVARFAEKRLPKYVIIEFI